MSSAPEVVHLAGSTPLVISMPHVGTGIPSDIAQRMNPRALRVEDTDWHVEHLYAFARDAGASWLQPSLSRYVVDLNRPPGDEALYPGQASTGLCPAMTFDGAPLYDGTPPDAAEIARRRERYWQPYHAQLQDLITRTRKRHGFCVLLDAHSIRSEVPRLFAGRLPDINVGTNDGRSCDPRLAAGVMQQLDAQTRFTHVLNGRFKGGYITRAYGRPDQGVHALQFELAQSAYMDEASAGWDAERALPLIRLLTPVINALQEFQPLQTFSD